MNNLVSVIIPLFNKRQSIASSIKSILSQTYNNLEIIVVDDGSTDASGEIVLSFHDPRLKYIYKENGGVSSARNRGLMEAEGNWILFLDADDILYPHCIDTLLSPILQRSDIQISCGNFDIIDDNRVKTANLKITSGIINNNYKSLFYHNFALRAGNFIIKKSLATRYPYNESFNRFEDMEVILNYLRNAIIHNTTISVMAYQKGYSELSHNCSKWNNDYTFNLTFQNKSFWEKCNQGKLIYLGWAGYKNLHLLFIKKYKLNIFWGLLSKALMLMTKLKSKV